MRKLSVRIYERGRGLPGVGDTVVFEDRLWRVEETFGGVFIDERPGWGNFIVAVLVDTGRDVWDLTAEEYDASPDYLVTTD